MSDTSDDDRFSMPPIAGVWEGRDAESTDADSDVADNDAPPPVSPGLPLPPPGLFARLAQPLDEPEPPTERVAHDDLAFDDDESEPHDDISDFDEDGEDEEDAADAVGAEYPAPRPGAADAVEQLLNQWASEVPAADADIELAGDNDALAEFDDDDVLDDDADPDSAPTPRYRAPAYALFTEDEEDAAATRRAQLE